MIDSSHLKGTLTSYSLMIEEPVPLQQKQPSQRKFNVKTIALLAFLIILVGIVAAWLSGLGILGVDPFVVIGTSFLIATIVACCGSMTLVGRVASSMPEYSELEDKYKEGKELFDEGDWQAALEIFKELAGPTLDHKRALYYGAICYQKLDDPNGMKKFCKAYLKMKPKDKEAWEMLAQAHKMLFEYEEAERALERASYL